MKKFKLVVPSFIALIFCMLLIAGSTFALFTSQASASISATSGKVKVTANLEDLELYSADHEYTTGDLAGTITDGDFAGTYYFKEQTGTFANGGTAALSTDGKSLVLEKMTPGDKVELALNLGNESNVNIKYRLKVTTSYKIGTREYDQALASALKFTFGTTTKNGLVAYQSNWIELAAGSAQPAALPIVIEFPLEKGNEFQDGGVVYNFLVEAVQGNAATSGSELFDTVELLMPNKSATKEAVDNVPTVLKVEDNNKTMVEVTVPAIAVAENETKEVELKVSDLFVEKSESTADSKVSMKIDLTINDVAATAADLGNEAVTAIVFVGTGLSNIEVVHNPGLENEVKLTAVNSLAELDEVNESYYDAETGYVTFLTNSFSPFSFTGDFAAALTVDNNTILYATFDKALEAANASTSTDALVIDVFKDQSFSAPTMISKSLTINGNNHRFTYSATRGIRVNASSITLNLNDLTLVGGSTFERGLQVDSDKTNVAMNINNCNVTSTYYAFNFCGGTSVEVNINKSVFTGWAALNIWSNGVSINAKNSTFIGINDKGEGSSNTFSTICLEADTTGMSPLHSSDMTVVFDDCTLVATTLNTNKQSIVGFNNSGSVGATNNIVTIKNSKILLNGETASLYYDNGTQNKLKVQNSKLNGENFETETPALLKSQLYDNTDDLSAAIKELDEQYSYVKAYVNGNGKYYFIYCLTSELPQE